MAWISASQPDMFTTLVGAGIEKWHTTQEKGRKRNTHQTFGIFSHVSSERSTTSLSNPIF
jgi:hypothetical protein